jgi:hypothetical protein
MNFGRDRQHSDVDYSFHNTRVGRRKGIASYIIKALEQRPDGILRSEFVTFYRYPQTLTRCLLHDLVASGHLTVERDGADLRYRLA